MKPCTHRKGFRTVRPPIRFRQGRVDQAHAEIWRRFVDLHNLVLDYCDLDGSIITLKVIQHYSYEKLNPS
jgi:hypothetical protein